MHAHSGCRRMRNAQGDATGSFAACIVASFLAFRGVTVNLPDFQSRLRSVPAMDGVRGTARARRVRTSDAADVRVGVREHRHRGSSADVGAQQRAHRHRAPRRRCAVAVDGRVCRASEACTLNIGMAGVQSRAPRASGEAAALQAKERSEKPRDETNEKQSCNGGSGGAGGETARCRQAARAAKAKLKGGAHR